MTTGKVKLISVFFIIAFAAFALFGVLYLSMVPVDLTRYHSSIEGAIESRTGKKIRLDRIIIKLFPSPDIRIQGMKTFQDNGQLMAADSMRLRISILPILKNNFIIHELDLDGAELDLKRDASGRINLEEFIKTRGKEEEKKKTNVVIEYLSIKNSRVNIVDEVPPGGTAFKINNIKASISGAGSLLNYRVEGRFMPDTFITFTGKLDPYTWDMKGTGAVKDLDLSRINPYLKRAQASINGSSNVDLFYEYDEKRSLRCFLSYKDLGISYPKVLNADLESRSGSAIVNFLPEPGGVAFSIDDARMHFDDFGLKGSFKLTGPAGKKSLALNIASTPIPLKTFKDLTPLKVLPRTSAERVRDLTPFDGTIEMDLALSGAIDDFKNGDFFKKPGGFSLGLVAEGLQFRYHNFKEEFSEVNWRSLLKDNSLSVFDLTARYGKETIDSLKGELRGLTGLLDYDLLLKGTFDAEEMLGMAKEFTTGKSAVSDRLSPVEALGELGIDLSAKGTLKGTAPVSDYHGSLNIANGSFSYAGLPVSLRSLNGDVDFDRKDLTVKRLSGADEHSTFELSGSVKDYSTPRPFFSVSAKGVLQGDTLKPFLQNTRAQELELDGGMPFTLKGEGYKDSFSGDAYLDAGQADVKYKRLVKKDTGYPLTLSASASLANKNVSVKRADLGFGRSSVSVTGNFSIGQPAYDLTAQSKMVLIQDLDYITPFLVEDLESGGLVTFDLNASRGPAEAEPGYRGSISIQEAHLKTPYLAKPIENITASAEFTDNSARVTLDNMTVGRSELRGTLEALDIFNRAIEFDLYSPHLYSEDLMPKGLKKEEAPEKETLNKKYPFGNGTILVNEGVLFGQPFKDLNISVGIAEKAVYLNPINLIIDNGRVSGQVTYNLDPAETLLFTADFNAIGLDLDTMLSGFGAKEKILTGNVNGKGRIAARRGAEPFSSGLNGQMSLHTDKGKLWKFNVFTKIFSIVNILSIDQLFKSGLPYKRIGGDFSLEDGVISTNNMFFNSNSMRMSAVGEINIPKKTIDSVIAMHPFVTLDKIISNIPLAGWIIAGKTRSAVSMYFDVEGPLADPGVSPAPVKGLEEGVLGILKRLIEAPAEILK